MPKGEVGDSEKYVDTADVSPQMFSRTKIKKEKEKNLRAHQK